MGFRKLIIVIFATITLFLVCQLVLTNFLHRKVSEDNLFSDVNILDKSYENKQLKKTNILDTIDFTSVNSIVTLVKKLNSIYPNQNNQRILSYYYTDSLFKKLSSNFLTYKPDYLNAILNWSVNLRNSAKYHKDLEFLLTVISDFWVSKVNISLQNISLTDGNVKFTFKYKYLVQICKNLNSNVDIKTTNAEKIINNILEKKWSYLWVRFYYGTSFFFKFSILLIILVLNYSLIFTLTYNYKKFKSNEENK